MLGFPPLYESANQDPPYITSQCPPCIAWSPLQVIHKILGGLSWAGGTDSRDALTPL